MGPGSGASNDVAPAPSNKTVKKPTSIDPPTRTLRNRG
jgi:hypothetical protein